MGYSTLVICIICIRMTRFKISLARTLGQLDWMARGDEAPRPFISLVKGGHGLSAVPSACLVPAWVQKRTASALKELTGRTH